ncbi:chromate resistance protein [Arenibacter sp. GZD96]|uniref:chromate resistance protein ChrB domain-containing protein n=1 Tax=Aurantibrevibacter litoralis TaxID=3106030 RepID=UPI002B003429|nr:chromate resistance protein ChrB domain-containing protein [Arenibacter sp. GZD-96]MEA1787557.1 chromate resistance protein [Arenibacter sp. GZD-96]
MKWITREQPKIDRLACPWLIKNFIDKKPEFFFVPANDVLKKSKEIDAIPFDIPNVEYSHYKEQVTFDYFLRKHNLTDPALHQMAIVIRGADTDRHDLAPEVAGLWAINLGLSHNIKDDYKLLEVGFVLYDALYTWAKYLKEVRHLEGSPFEKTLHEVYLKFIKNKKGRSPAWVKELKYLIQDQLDAQFTIDLRKLSEELNLNSAYVSREFPRYFDNKNFGEYIRNERIKKAKELFSNPEYSLTEIAYLTGFSDQSHFTRVFKQITGESPSTFRKKWLKSKSHSKG